MSNARTRKRGKYWEYEFDTAKIAGKRNRISKCGYRTKSEAVAAGAAAMAEYNSSGFRFVPSEMSYADFLDYWMESYCSIALKKTPEAGAPIETFLPARSATDLIAGSMVTS